MDTNSPESSLTSAPQLRFGKIDDVYHWHILAKTTAPALLLDDLSIRPGWTVDVDPVDIL